MRVFLHTWMAPPLQLIRMSGVLRYLRAPNCVLAVSLLLDFLNTELNVCYYNI